MLNLVFEHIKRIVKLKHDGSGLPNTLTPFMGVLIGVYIINVLYVAREFDPYLRGCLIGLGLGATLYIISPRIFSGLAMIQIGQNVALLLILPMLLISKFVWIILYILIQIYSAICLAFIFLTFKQSKSHHLDK